MLLFNKYRDKRYLFILRKKNERNKINSNRY